MTPGQRPEPVDALARPPTQRAQTIGKLYVRPEARHVAELLTTVEEDDFVRATVVEE